MFFSLHLDVYNSVDKDPESKHVHIKFYLFRANKGFTKSKREIFSNHSKSHKSVNNLNMNEKECDVIESFHLFSRE